MLSNSQVERYCRQIVLPEMGSLGQERLLRSTVSIRGEGSAVAMCVSYLAGAGVGRLAVARIPGLATGVRPGDNPDCSILDAPVEDTDVSVWVGEIPGPAARGAVLWGRAAGDTLVRVAFPRDRACPECLRAAALADAGEPPSPASEITLGAVLAADTLRVLLGLALPAAPEVFRNDLARGEFTLAPLPSRPGCPVCVAP